MSVKLHLYDSQFVISAPLVSVALMAMNHMLKTQYTEINDALGHIGLQAEFDHQGSVFRLLLINDYAAPEITDALAAIAHYVNDGSYLTLSDDDGGLWQYAFLGRQLETRTLPPGFIFPRHTEVEDLRQAHDLLDSADVPRRRRGKVLLTLTGRLALLLSRENPNESRTS